MGPFPPHPYLPFPCCLQYAIEDSMYVVDEFIEMELKKKRYRNRMRRLEYRFSTDLPYFAWWGGRVDPRLIGGFAVIHATMVAQRRTISLSGLLSLC